MDFSFLSMEWIGNMWNMKLSKQILKKLNCSKQLRKQLVDL